MEVDCADPSPDLAHGRVFQPLGGHRRRENRAPGKSGCVKLSIGTPVWAKCSVAHSIVCQDESGYSLHVQLHSYHDQVTAVVGFMAPF